jgi:hypothetical protein
MPPSPASSLEHWNDGVNTLSTCVTGFRIGKIG